MKNKLIIIGSGLAGLSAAENLKNFFDIKILDKGKVVGGRVCTHIKKNFHFNHGAQFFTAKSNLFKKVMINACKKNLLNIEYFNNKIIYTGNPYMRSIMEYLAKDKNIIQSTEILKIKYYNRKFICFSKKHRFCSDAIIITAPANQSINLIKKIDPAFANHIKNVSFFPCYCLMVKINSKLTINKKHYTDEIISSFTVENNNNVSNCSFVTIHSNYQFSEITLDKDNDFIINKMLNFFVIDQQLSKKKVEIVRFHRWLYSKVKKSLNKNVSFMSKKLPLSIAGDWHPGYYNPYKKGIGNRAEDAFLSGLHSSILLKKKLGFSKFK